MRVFIYITLLFNITTFAKSDEYVPLTIDRIEEIITTEQIGDLDHFLKSLGEEQKSVVSLMINSKSPQDASLMYPRVIFQPSEDIYMAFSTNPNDKSYQVLEVIEYNEDVNDYEFHKIVFDSRSHGLSSGIKNLILRQGPKSPKVYRNEKSCKSCHRLGPLWDGYAFWSGTFGSYHQPRHFGSIIGENNSIRSYEQSLWMKNVKKYKKLKRLRQMKGAFLKENPLSHSNDYSEIRVRDLEDNNLQLTINITKQYSNILSNKVSDLLIGREDLMPAFNHLFNYTSKYDLNVDHFLQTLPQSLRSKFRDGHIERLERIKSSIEDHLNLSINEQSKIHSLNPMEFYPQLAKQVSFDNQNNAPYFYALWDFLLSELDIELSNYSPARKIGRGNYLFNDGGAKPWGGFFIHLREEVDKKLNVTSEFWRSISKISIRNSMRSGLSCHDAVKNIVE